MSPRRSPQTAVPTQFVAVIASLADLKRATRLRRLPDFFELRLDCLHNSVQQLLSMLPKLRAPLIISARHPAEGGMNRLPVSKRRSVLLKFLPLATFVDVELRSVAQLAAVLDRADDLKVGRILSVHNFSDTPDAAELKRLARAATRNRADIFKLVTRAVDTEQRTRLIAFFLAAKPRMRISVMSAGIGARALRLLFAQQGSALNYTHLGKAQVQGQWSLGDLRRAIERRRF